MKRYIYVLALMVSFMSLVACSKNDPAPASPVVGRWELNRGLLNSFPTSSTLNVNGGALDLYLIENIGSTIDIFSDNTFNLNYKNVTVDDETGTWALDNNTNLTLTYDLGGTETYTYSKTKNIEELTSTQPSSYTLAPPLVPTTIVGTITPIYRK